MVKIPNLCHPVFKSPSLQSTYTALLCIVKPQLAHTDEWRTENGLCETVIGQDTRTSVDLSMSKAQTQTDKTQFKLLCLKKIKFPCSVSIISVINKNEMISLGFQEMDNL